MYDKKCISDVTSHAFYPLPPVTNCHTFSDPLPLERDVLYGRPLGKHIGRMIQRVNNLFVLLQHVQKVYLQIRFVSNKTLYAIELYIYM